MNKPKLKEIVWCYKLEYSIKNKFRWTRKLFPTEGRVTYISDDYIGINLLNNNKQIYYDGIDNYTFYKTKEECISEFKKSLQKIKHHLLNVYTESIDKIDECNNKIENIK